MLLHYLAKHGNMELAYFHSNAAITALPDFNQLLLDFCNLLNSQLILALVMIHYSLLLMDFSSGVLGAIAEKKWSFELQQFDCCTPSCLVYSLAEKQNYRLQQRV